MNNSSFSFFLVVDDLRPDLGAFKPSNPPPLSQDAVRTPNLDALAADSAVFERAYASSALCGPSRPSILTGRRPATTRVYDNKHDFRQASGNPRMAALPQHFRERGYRTFCVGKIFHNFDPPIPDPLSWTEPTFEGIEDFYKYVCTYVYSGIPIYYSGIRTVCNYCTTVLNAANYNF